MPQTHLYNLTIRLLLHSWNLMLISDTVAESNLLADQTNSNKELSISSYNLTPSYCTAFHLSWDLSVLGEHKRFITTITQIQVAPITTAVLYMQFWWEAKSSNNHTILIQDTVKYWTIYLHPYLPWTLDLFQTRWKKSQRFHQVVFGCVSEWSCLNNAHSLGSQDSPDNLT